MSSSMSMDDLVDAEKGFPIAAGGVAGAGPPAAHTPQGSGHSAVGRALQVCTFLLIDILLIALVAAGWWCVQSLTQYWDRALWVVVAFEWVALGSMCLLLVLHVVQSALVLVRNIHHLSRTILMPGLPGDGIHELSKSN